MISVPKVKLIGNSLKQYVLKIDKKIISRFINVNNYTVAWTGNNDLPMVNEMANSPSDSDHYAHTEFSRITTELWE